MNLPRANLLGATCLWLLATVAHPFQCMAEDSNPPVDPLPGLTTPPAREEQEPASPGEEPPDTSPAPATAAPMQPKPPQPALEHQHEAVSKLVEALLRRADSLFSGDYSVDAPTGSYVQLIARTTQRRPADASSDYDLLPRAKITLPKTNDRLQVFLEQDLPNAGRSETQRDAQTVAGQQPRDLTQYLGLRGIGIERLRTQLTADVGVRMRIPPDPFARVRAQRIFALEDWKIPLSETLLYRTSDQGSSTTELGFLRPLGKDFALSLNTTATWREVTRYFELGETAMLTQRIDPRSLIHYELGVYGQTEPNTRTTVYSAALRYRRRLYSDWLLMEVRPELLYPRDRAFHPLPSITFQLEMYFGEHYLAQL